MHLGLGMVLHVRSDELDGSILCGVDGGAALAEEHGGLQVGGGSILLHLNGALQALVELTLQVGQAALQGVDVAVLCVELAAEVIDLSVQTVDEGLVELMHGEVVCAVAVAELVDEAGVELHSAAVDVVLSLVVAGESECAGHCPVHRGLDIELPSLLSAQVEYEVDGGL